MIRTSALGDVVHCLPVLSSLRRNLPEAAIAWVVEGAMEPVLRGHPDLDELFVVGMRAWRHRLTARQTRQEILDLRRRLRAFQADVVLDLMGNHKAGALALLSGCRRRVGLERRARREPSSAVWINETVPPQGDHAIDRAMSTLGALGIREDRVDFEGEKLFRQPSAEADRLTASAKPYVLLSPGAGWHNKRYPTQSWAEAAQRLAESAPVEVWVTCGPGEQALAEAVVSGGHEKVRLIGPTDLPTLAWLIRRSRLFLGGDTGPLHLAHALGTPVLSIMGPTDPAKHGPYGAPELALALSLPCSGCYRRMEEPKACMKALPAHRVADQAVKILNAHVHLAIN